MTEDAKDNEQDATTDDDATGSPSDLELIQVALGDVLSETQIVTGRFIPPPPIASNVTLEEMVGISHLLRIIALTLRGNRSAARHIQFAMQGIDRAIYPTPKGQLERKLFFLGYFLERLAGYCRLTEELRSKLQWFKGLGHFLAVCDKRFADLDSALIPEQCKGLTWKTIGTDARGWIKIAAELAASVQAFDYDTADAAQKDLKKRWSERDKERFPDPEEPLYDIPL